MKLNQFFAALVLGCFTLPVFAQTGSFKVNESSFPYIYNNYRQVELSKTPWVGTYWPYGEKGLAWDWDGNGSPAHKWDSYWSQENLALNWEVSEHSCEDYVGTDYFDGCEGWWGHCNAWAAAAIMEEEPRAAGQKRNDRGDDLEYFSTADKKGYLTEVWMSSNSLFAGNTNKSIETEEWVCDPSSPKAKATRRGVTNYDSFWDLNPRDFLLILTNYIGIQDKGIVIDRFTGDQVWNQPVVAYRMAEVTKEDITKREVDGVELYAVNVHLDIYWANDGVEPDLDTAKFDFENLDEESFEERALGLTLFFDDAVQIDRGQITAAGNMVGTGIWDHQDDCSSWSADDGHPDFAWRPTRLTAYGNANPHIQSERVYEVLEKQPLKEDAVKPDDDSDDSDSDKPDEVDDHTHREWSLTFKADDFNSLKAKFIKRQIKQVFRRALLLNHIHYREITVEDDKVSVPVKFVFPVNAEKIRDAVADSGLQLNAIAAEDHAH